MIARVASGIHVGEYADTHGHGMGTHMQAVGQQGHGTEPESRGNLHHHGYSGQDQYQQGTLLPWSDLILAEYPVALPLGDIVLGTAHM